MPGRAAHGALQTGQVDTAGELDEAEELMAKGLRAARRALLAARSEAAGLSAELGAGRRAHRAALATIIAERDAARAEAHVLPPPPSLGLAGVSGRLRASLTSPGRGRHAGGGRQCHRARDVLGSVPGGVPRALASLRQPPSSRLGSSGLPTDGGAL